MMPEPRKRVDRCNVDEIKARWNISDVVGRKTRLKKAGPRELVGICVFHKERSPSLRVNDAKGIFHCFGCGASGDVVRFVMETEGLGFVDALRWLGAADLPEADPAERARAETEDEAIRQAAIDEARRIWCGAREAGGTPAEVYARSRGIVMPLPPSIRFAETYAWVDKETGETGPDLPALISAVTDGAGEVIAIQRIFLRDGGRAKANMRRPKLSLGRIKGGALKLDIGFPISNEIIIIEGPEDGLTLAQEMPGRRVWVALGTAFMPEVQLPRGASVILAGDNDDAGRAAILKAAKALEARGHEVGTMFPAPGFKDFNDQLRGVRR